MAYPNHKWPILTQYSSRTMPASWSVFFRLPPIHHPIPRAHTHPCLGDSCRDRHGADSKHCQLAQKLGEPAHAVQGMLGKISPAELLSRQHVLPETVAQTGPFQYFDLSSQSEPAPAQTPGQNPSVHVIPEASSPALQPEVEPSVSNTSSLHPDVPAAPSTSSLHPDVPAAPLEPSDIPVPEDTEDDLLSEAFILVDPDDDDMHGSLSDNPFRPSSSEAWVCEIFITQADVQCWRQEKQPEQMAFAVSAAKRQRSEVKLATLTPSQQEEFRAAKSKEVQSWLDTGTVQRILRNKLPLDSILRCRWILSWKPLDGTQDAHVDPKNPKTRKAKARLVILGYEDPQIDSIPRDSPTLGRDARALLLQLIASCKWDVMSFDVRTAFLRGRAQEGRILGLEPPEETAPKDEPQA